MMKFEVIGIDNKTIFQTEYKECIPTKTEIESMYKAGYKFKIDGKVATKKKVLEIQKDKKKQGV